MPAPKEINFYENPFGFELRRLRGGMTQAQLSERLGYTPEHISKVETGAEVPGEDFARDCDTYFDAKGTLRALALVTRHRAGLPRWAREWFDTEREANTLRYWELAVIPGVLQTPDYARELLRMHPGMAGERVEELVAARMERKKILDEEDPPTLWFVVDEIALHRQTGSPKVMYDQLQALVEASYHSHISIQVVPMSVGQYIGNVGAFAIASFNGEPDVVYLESARAGRVSERPEDVRAMTNIWQAICTEALSPRASLDLISKVMGAMDLTGAEWRKASRSSSNGGNCVEVAAVGRRVAVRDSKARTGPVLAFTPGTWGAFLGDAKRGQYDIR